MFKKPRRTISRVFLHCSASDNPLHDNTVVIDGWHRQRGFTQIGYHYYISKDGKLHEGRPINSTPAAQEGHNTGTIAICLGGLDVDKFTFKQFHTLRKLCSQIRDAIPKVTFHGHTEVNPAKTCPVFPYRAILGLDKNGVMHLAKEEI